MTPRWRVLTLMTIVQAGASVVQQALGSLSPILVATFAISKTQLGAIFTALMFGSASFTAAAGVMTDRWGERRMVLYSGIAMTIALLAVTLVQAYWWVVLWVFVFGVGYAVSTPAGGRAVLAWFDRDRGLAMGIRQTGVPVGGFAGALTLPFVAHAFGYRGAFVFAAVIIAVSTLIAVVPYREAPREPNEGGPSIVAGMRTLARDPRLIGVTLTCMILSGVQQTMNAFVTVTGVTLVGVSPRVAALAFACAQGAAVAGRLGWGFVSDRMLRGERLVPFAIICVLAAGAAAALSTLRAGAVVPLFAAALVLGFSGAGWNGLMAAALAEVGGVDRAASALGLALTAIFAASAIAPALFGAVADHTSLRVSWLFASALALVAMAPVLWLRAHLAAPLRRSETRAG